MSRTVTVSLVPQKRTVLQRVRQSLRSYWSGSVSLKDPMLNRLFGSGYTASSGIQVTPENAFTFSAVYSAVNQISSDIAKLPLNLHKKRQDGGSDLYAESPLFKLLKLEPNPEMGSMVFRRTILAHALTLKGGFAEIERDNAARPKALWLLTPDRVEPKRRERVDGTLGPLEYLLDGKTWIPDHNMLHIHGLGYDGYSGYGVIDKARQAIGLALAAERFGGQYFSRGTQFGGWLETDKDIDEDQKKEIVGNIKEFQNAQDSAFRILVTEVGHKFHQFSNKPSDSQMDELRVRQVEEVARFFRIPPYRLGVNTPGTVSYASVEAANLDYYTGCLMDWIKLVEEEWTRKLISGLEWKQQYIKHNVNAWLRGDTKSRHESYALLLDRGVYNADHVLELEDLNPQPAGQGKLFLVNSTMVPKDKLSEAADARIAADKAKANPPEPTEKDPVDPDAVDRAERRAADAEARVVAMATKLASAELRAEDRDRYESQLIQLREAAAAECALRDELKARYDTDVQDANDRATRAEQVATDAREQAEALRLQIAAMEAPGGAQSDEVTTLREALQSQQVIAANLTVLSQDLRGRAEQLEASHAVTETELRDAIDAKARAEAAAEQARAAVTLAEQQKGEADAATLTARQQETATRDAHAAAQRRVAELETALVERDAPCPKCNDVGLPPERFMGDPLGQIPCDCESGQKVAADIAARDARAAADAAESARAEMESVAATRAAELEAVRAEADRLSAELSAKGELQQQIDTMQALLDAQQSSAQTEVVALKAALAQAEQEREAARQAAVDVETRAVERQAQIDAERASEAEQIAIAQRAVEAAQRIAADAIAKTVAEAEERAAAEARAVEAAARVAEVLLLRDSADRLAEDARAIADAAEQRAAEEAAAKAHAEARAGAAEAARQAQRAVEIERMTGTIGAHRALVADAMGRMVRREVEKARRHQATPGKLRNWLTTLDTLHADVCVEALLPAVRTHLAWSQSAEDPQTATERLVRQHVTTFTERMTSVADVDASEFHTTLAKTLERWEAEQPERVADQMMQEQIAYLRAYERRER